MIQDLHDKTKNNYPRPQDTWQRVPVGTTDHGGEPTSSETRKVRSVRSRRTIFTLACTAFSVGALIIVLTSPVSNEFLAPGPLCSSHAQILAGQGADRCAACHGAADQSVASWISDALTGGTTINVSQSELCMKCHQDSINSSRALNPHNIAASELEERSKKFQQASFVSRGMTSFSPVNHANEIACSACHREHHGKADLKAMTDQQCQSCHSQVYHSFETDHPEFTNWPQQRRSRIAFDHSTHAGKHFPGKQAEFNCNQCHIDDDYRNVKMLASFDQACAKCHQQSIDESCKSGLALLALPMVDTVAIEQHQQDIGGWPLAATGDFDGPIPPIMRLLLCGDTRAATLLDRLGQQFEFSDVDPDDVRQVTDAVELVWAIKRLLHELSVDGQQALQRRMSIAMRRTVGPEEIRLLAHQLDRSVFRNVARRWLPNLEAELAERQPATEVSSAYGRSLFQLVKFGDLLAANPLHDLMDSDQPASDNPVSEVEQPTSPVLEPSTQVGMEPAIQLPDTNRDESVLLQEPGSLPADPSLAWGATEPETREAGDEPSVLPANDRQPSSSSITLKSSSADVPEDSGLLAINPLATAVPSAALTTDSDLTRAGNPTDETTADLHREPTAPSSPVARQEDNQWPPEHFTGWYRDDKKFRVAYCPSGHDDTCLKEWSDVAAGAIKADQRTATSSLFRRMLSETGIGLCRSCHTVDQLQDDSFTVNWKAKYRDPSVRDFTRFSHGPHTLQPHLQDCSHCHDMSAPVGNQETFVGTDSTVAVSNFAPITKMSCADCHREGQTENGCTHCHNYHVGSIANPAKD